MRWIRIIGRGLRRNTRNIRRRAAAVVTALVISIKHGYRYGITECMSDTAIEGYVVLLRSE